MAKRISFILLALINSISYANPEQETAIATFAGGCFWCMEKPFDVLPGVMKTVPGYIGGHTRNPSYEQVSNGTTGHYEAIQILYNSKKISYQQLLEVFWKNIDPTNGEGQFCDKGLQYRSAIFYHDDEQKQLAVDSKQALEQKKRYLGPFKTTIEPAATFYPAEDYHHNYYLKNPLTYKFYRYTCGRDKRLNKIWGKASG